MVTGQLLPARGGFSLEFKDYREKAVVQMMDHNFPPPEIQVGRIARDVYDALGRPNLKEDNEDQSNLWDQILEETETLDINSLFLVISQSKGKDLLSVYPSLPVSQNEIGERLLERLAATAILAKIREFYG